MKFRTLYLCAGMLVGLLLPTLSAVAESSYPSVNVIGPVQYMGQDIYCDATYKVSECNAQIKAVVQRLHRYPLEQLGPWTWILVRSDAWKTLTQSLHLDSASPAFTSLEERTTFLEEALIEHKAPRGAELMRGFQVPLQKLLDLALAHELGHALCDVVTEGEARLISERLLSNKEADCASLRDGKTKELLTMKNGIGAGGK